MADDVLYNEVHRPQFHFTAARNWLNDPNGLVFYRGEYHLFFQHNPEGTDWGNMTWGHAVSPDMIHWTQLADALKRDALGTMFSGSAVVDSSNTAGFQNGEEETIVAIYTAAGGTSPESQGQPFTQCLAYSNDRGRTFTKYEGNPVLGHIAAENRDPKVIWHAPTKKWVMALYLKDSDYALFGSPDLKRWEKLCDVAVPGASECPDFFELPVDNNTKVTRWVFWGANGMYLIGAFDGKAFTPESGPHPSQWGANFYAAQTWSDISARDGRRLQIGWMNGGQYPGMPFNQQMSFPCELTLHTTPGGIRLFRNPVREIEKLEATKHSWGNRALKPGENLPYAMSGELLELRAEIKPGAATEFGFTVRGEKVAYDVARGELVCLDKAAPLALADETITLQVLLDRTSIEVFGNDGQVSLQTCFLPDLDDRSLSIYAVGGEAQIVSLDVYELRSIWTR